MARPRVYPKSWARVSQRWPVGMLRELEEAAAYLGLTRQQLVVDVVEQWLEFWRKEYRRRRILEEAAKVG